MIYLVTKQESLFTNDAYKKITPEESLKMLLSGKYKYIE